MKLCNKDFEDEYNDFMRVKVLTTRRKNIGKS